MAKTEPIIRYNLIIKKLRRKSCDFDEIADYLALESELQGLNLQVSKRTFQRDLKAIYTIYNIDIQFDFSSRAYFIDFEQQPELNNRLLEAFDTFNALSISERLSKNIQFEQRQAQGTQYLHDFLNAIKNKVFIEFNHQKFWDTNSETRKVQPLALKEFKSRWYVIAKDTKDGKIKSFGLDRITNPKSTNQKFEEPESFDVNAYYKHSFGIIGSNGLKPQEIILSFHEYQGKYIKTLPLHHSQEIISDNSKELIVKLKLIITYDFIMELMSMGENVKVIKPQSLIKTLKTKAQKILNHYN
ncbi:YafY family protein [Flavobacterium sp. CS20]|uniref:helix-turn-helix transcriptional regulator n=1 Tax=Flavobacterium sp. CS20 TaxID=2775246 RepID=UPI001B3A6B21|nr:WYL domain-containing protein [Flavobacterium sp. CS20]QTY27062.1 WYL domain-containing protein [Flavobacterium sp. CS20]